MVRFEPVLTPGALPTTTSIVVGESWTGVSPQANSVKGFTLLPTSRRLGDSHRLKAELDSAARIGRETGEIAQ